ncbi:MAG: glycosyltransferase [Acholeplasma sp.]|nr:glycosyltransferase [Acholeplasma sp.]
MKKVMLHLIMPNQISGPNTANKILFNSYLNEYFSFSFLLQNSHSGLKLNLKLLKDMSSQIKKEKPDLVHVSGLQTSGLYAVLAAKIRKRKILITIRGFSGSATNIGIFKRFLYNKIVEPLQLIFCDYFYTVSEQANRNPMLKRFKKKNLGFIHNSAPIINGETSSLSRSDISLSDSDFILAYSGRVTFDKGMFYLCEAMKKNENQNIKLLIIGEGSYSGEIRKNYKDLIDDKIFLLGQRTDVLELLKISNVFVFPTLHENLSNSLLEACAIGLPVIATNVGGNPEVIVDDFNGLLVPSKSSDALVKSINRLYSSREACKKFSTNTKKIINDKFSQDKLLVQVKEIYDYILKV